MSQATPEDIKLAVTERYGAKARRASLTGDTLPLEIVGGSDEAVCCDDACCTPAQPNDEQLSYVEGLYADSETAGLPTEALAAAAGCGNPTAIAELKPGEVVLDLGSGGGIDCFLAARQVGPSGKVIGVDMTPDMVNLARRNATKLGVENVTFKLGEIEDLPLPDASVDVIISNCVINLSPDKQRVFQEAFRVLRPGGRLRVSDMVWDGERPADAEGLESWAGCIAGALPLADYLDAIAAAGFVNVSAEPRRLRDDSDLASALVYAEKPAV